MRLVFIILGFISAIIAVTLAYLPFGLIALIPAVIAFILGLLAFRLSKKEAASTLAVKLIFLLTIIALALTTYRSITNENTLNSDTEFIEKQEESEEESLEELEGLDTNAGSGD